MGAFGFELKQAVRRVFTWWQTGAILIPSIGLALATIMFAVGWGYSSLSLPYKDADRLVIVGYVDSFNEDSPFLENYQLFFDWKEQADIFTDVAALRRTQYDFGWIMSIRTDNGYVALVAADATTNFFDTLGVSFPGIQGWKEAANVKNPFTMVLTNNIGVNRFGYESIGKLFPGHEGGSMISGGILPGNFVMPLVTGVNAFTPVELRPGDRGNLYQDLDVPLTDITSNPLTVVARLAPGVTPRLAEQMLAARSGGVYTNPRGEQGRLSVRSIGDDIAARWRPSVIYSWALGALILILCAANLGGILLTRCTYRLREYAVCSALGATLSNLVRTLLLELCGIAVIAALIASVAARNAIPYIADMVPITHEAFGRPVFEREAVIFLIAATIAVMFASAAPSIAVLARNYYKGFSQGILAVFRSHRTLRFSLTVGQTAIATLLLCVSLMTVRGYSDIFFRDTGLNEKARIVSVSYPVHQRLAGMSVDVYDTLDVLGRGNPGIRAASLVAGSRGDVFDRKAPLARQPVLEKTMMEQYGAPENSSLNLFSVTPGFFQTLDVKIIAGRDFNDDDLYERAVIVNEAFVRKMEWTPWEAIGREIYAGGTIRVIIGVCGDFLTASWDSDIWPEFYAPIHRGQIVRPSNRGMIHYIIHPDDLPRASNVGNIEKTLRDFYPDATITRNSSWGDVLGETVRERSFVTLCITLFAIAGIATVVTGIVGTVAFIVARRTRDIAIQVALGAPPVRVCWFVVKDMVIAGVSGALIGGLVSWWIGKAVAHYVYNGEKYQNITGLAIAAVIMLVIIAAAALLPALRALRIEPGRALNME